VAPAWGAPSAATKSPLWGMRKVRTMGLVGDRSHAKLSP